MKFTHIVVKAKNGKPNEKQIDQAAMVKNAGQAFALVHGFKEDPKSAILVDGTVASKMEKHQESHGFEIYELDKPESGEPTKPGDEINESLDALILCSQNKMVSDLAALLKDEYNMHR